MPCEGADTLATATRSPLWLRNMIQEKSYQLLYDYKYMYLFVYGLEGRVARIGENRSACSVPLGSSGRKRALTRPRRRWEDDFNMNRKEIGWVVWSGFIWLRIETNGGLLWTRQWTLWTIPLNAANLLTNWATTSFSRTQLHGVSFL
jgi:hypothetical protein